MIQQALQLIRGDSRTLSVTSSEDITSAVSLIFTAKVNRSLPDTQAVIQKFVGGGLTGTGTSLSVSLVYADTKDLHSTVLVWDVQAQLVDGSPHTVAEGTLTITADVTQALDTSIPVFTSQPSAQASAATSALAAQTAETGAQAALVACEAAVASVGHPSLSDITNVLITSPAQGDRLAYNSSDGKWENSSITDGGFF